MPRKPTKREHIEIDSIKHDDTRVNIPTAQTSPFMTDAQRAGEEKVYPRYRRDPALDPQLVWQGKDQEDADDLRVLVRPIYINEKIRPRTIVEGIRDFAAQGMPYQLDMFNDFNGISFEDAVDFYNHEQHWTNRMILGDSLVVMAGLAEKEGLRGKVQMIYLDPPYGIKFNSNWQPSTLKRDVKDGKDKTYEPEQIQAFRDTWQNGIHSYLSYLRNRLRIARELLTESGSIFVQISDENIHRIRCLMDEIFGDKNFCSLITVRKTGGLGSSGLTTVADYVIWYCKDANNLKYRPLYLDKAESGTAEQYSYALSGDGQIVSLKKEEPLPSNTQAFQPTSLHTMFAGVQSCLYDFDLNGKTFRLPPNRQWSTTSPNMLRIANAGRIFTGGNTPRFIRLLNDFPVVELTNIWSDLMGSDDKMYVVQTNSQTIQRCLMMTTDPGDLVLDPTCGSGTTAYVAEHWGRRWITIDTSRVALTLARTRLMTARFPSYKLKGEAIRDGFVYKTVPHITLKNIGNNQEIDVIHTRYQPQLDDLHLQINTLSQKLYEEWEIPRPNPDAEPSPLQELLTQWWRVRRQRQGEIDKSIRANADMETLYDQPEIKTKAVRVTGSFTVEGLQPHRSVEPGKLTTDPDNAARFALDMLEQLRETGVTNTRKGEKIMFATLDLYPGKHIHASGTYEQAGQVGRVAVLIGPQYGTVSRNMIQDAAIEAVRGNRFDMLIVCGFAFDPTVTEETKNYGRLLVQTARINPDLLLMGKDLKKDSKTNLFTVFGEPDIVVNETDEGKLVVELLGVDVYDPNTGSLRINSTDEIACWFIDTNYNETSFFVCHAYFTGADEPFDKLKAALKAEINPDAWELLYRTESIPFDRPANGKIAVKVINHYGDEVMKIIEAG